MKRLLLVSTALMVLALSGTCLADAAGSHFGSFSTARTLGMGHGAFGLGVGLADRTSFVGSFNYGLSRFTEGRIKLGLVDVSIMAVTARSSCPSRRTSSTSSW